MKSATASGDRRVDSSWWAKRQQYMLRRLLAPLANARRGVLRLSLPDGHTLEFGSRPCETLTPTLRLNHWRGLRKAFAGGALGWAQGYVDGDWDSPCATTLVEWVIENEVELCGALDGGRLRNWLQQYRHRRNRNSKRGSRRNIAYHYDLGNAFYRYWLDESMTYSAALFRHRDDTLSQAQQRKYQRVIDELEIVEGDRVLEIGCGWGGFAEYLGTRHPPGLNVWLDGITLSEQQLQYARTRLANAELGSQMQLSLTDYRDTAGNYDKVVSIEMLEAVGEAYWPSYFQTLAQRLKPGGRALIQTIVIEAARFEQYRKSPDFIQSYIFPGGMLPTADICRRQARESGLQVVNELAFGGDYARTLELWEQAFNQHWDEIARLGFDQRFKRMWHYYLAYCIAGFRKGSIDVYQFTLEKPMN